MAELSTVLAMTFLASLALTAWTRRIALHHGILDHPNERSSHSQPTPRGGGVAIVISSSCAILWLIFRHGVDVELGAALVGGGVLVAGIGFLDDRHSLPAGIRLFTHAAAAAWAVYLLGGLSPIRLGAHVVSLGIWGDAAAAIVIVWVINLFNFMDGIDGIAASEAAFIGCAGGALTFLYVHDLAVGYSAWAIGAAALAFLWWNWPPAKIFMGDVGSCYLGYAIAVLGLAAGRSSPVASLAWLILGGVFYADATTTLLVRLARRQRIYLAHRDHAYQSLARQWNSHRSVTLLVFAINLVAPLPLAVLAFLYQEWAVAIAAITLLCLSAAVLLLHIFKPSF